MSKSIFKLVFMLKHEDFSTYYLKGFQRAMQWHTGETEMYFSTFISVYWFKSLKYFLCNLMRSLFSPIVCTESAIQMYIFEYYSYY